VNKRLLQEPANQKRTRYAIRLQIILNQKEAKKEAKKTS
jgi:hypothetical protein